MVEGILFCVDDSIADEDSIKLTLGMGRLVQDGRSESVENERERGREMDV